MPNPDLSICILSYNRRDKLIRLLDSLKNQIVPSTIHRSVSVSIHDNSSSSSNQLNEYGPSNLLSLEWIHSFSYIHNSINIGYDFNYISSVLASHGLWTLVFGDDDFFAPSAVSSILQHLESCSLDSCLMLPTYYLIGKKDLRKGGMEPASSRHPLFADYSSQSPWNTFDLRTLPDLTPFSAFTGFLGGIVYPTNAMLRSLSSVSGVYCVSLRTKGYIHQCLGLHCITNILTTIHISNRPLWSRDTTSIDQQIILAGSVAERSVREIDWMYELNRNWADLHIAPSLIHISNAACLRDAIYMLKMQPFFSKFHPSSLRLFVKVFLYGLITGCLSETCLVFFFLLPWFEVKTMIKRLSLSRVVSRQAN